MSPEMTPKTTPVALMSTTARCSEASSAPLTFQQGLHSSIEPSSMSRRVMDGSQSLAMSKMHPDEREVGPSFDSCYTEADHLLAAEGEAEEVCCPVVVPFEKLSKFPLLSS